uniref:Osteoclast-stimulating factor 1 n=1 Tax=Cynoglossus semilaevis TaxID=244447 RepID=A0A3P8UTZ5_CYNSE
MELWRQCALWLIDCRVLPENHRVTWEGAQVCDLAQALRDGVLLCQLLNNLLPQAVNLREINLRPQMSQFLCLKNIRTFLGVCQERFQLKKSELFEAFDLFDVRDFGKVTPFPLQECAPDDEIYSGLSDQIDNTVDEDDDLYDFVDDEDNEGDEIYEDLMRTEEPPEKKTGVDKRECCLQEIRQTEEKYTDTLNSILQHFMKPLERFLQDQDIESIFINLQDLAVIHHQFLEEVQTSILQFGATDLYQVFISYKERLLHYGRYCSQVETATKHLDKLSTTREDIRMKLEECSKRANSGRFSLRDLLMVPMQRVLKYPLLLQELVKHTNDPTDKDNLRLALDAMRDLAQCVNEVKRDNEIIRQITAFQMSIENMVRSLVSPGPPQRRSPNRTGVYVFLFDKAMFVCKKKSGESFELKETIELQHYHLRDEIRGDKDKKKWSHAFLLLDCYGRGCYDLYFKTREVKKKWLEQFEMALSNTSPEDATANNHDFQMNCFEETTSCKACSMLLRGTFFQGYRCTRCKMAAHKECLSRLPACGRTGGILDRYCLRYIEIHPHRNPKMEVCQDYYGLPPPPVGFGQPLHLYKGNIIELTRADADLQWWEGRNLNLGNVGWFPCQKVQPYVVVSTTVLQFAGNMDRTAAKNLLLSRSNGTFLVRQKDAGEFAISIKFNVDVRHIKITSADGLFRINDKKAFRGLAEMIEFYQKNSLKEYFKDLDTTLETPYTQPDQLDPSFSVARARYDFSARDRSELSLREGDTIKILSKKGHNGWWKGEVYGRVGFFPANYVDEDYSEYC